MESPLCHTWVLGFLLLAPEGSPGLVSLASTALPPPHVRGALLSIDRSRPQRPSGPQFLCWTLPSLGSRKPLQEASVLSLSNSKLPDLPLRAGKSTRRGHSSIFRCTPCPLIPLLGLGPAGKRLLYSSPPCPPAVPTPHSPFPLHRMGLPVSASFRKSE